MIYMRHLRNVCWVRLDRCQEQQKLFDRILSVCRENFFSSRPGVCGGSQNVCLVGWRCCDKRDCWCRRRHVGGGVCDVRLPYTLDTIHSIFRCESMAFFWASPPPTQSWHEQRAKSSPRESNANPKSKQAVMGACAFGWKNATDAQVAGPINHARRVLGDRHINSSVALERAREITAG